MAILEPSIGRMNVHAIRVLEQARARATDRPIKATPEVRLALAVLTMNKVAEPWQCYNFFEALTKECTNPAQTMADYIRNRDMDMFLRRWRTDANVPEDTGSDG